MIAGSTGTAPPPPQSQRERQDHEGVSGGCAQRNRPPGRGLEAETGHAGAEHGQHRQRITESDLPGPAQHHGAANDRQHADEDAAVHVLAEHDPGDDRREYALRIEQQGRT